MALLLQHEFEASGVHLPTQDRDEVARTITSNFPFYLNYHHTNIHPPGPRGAVVVLGSRSKGDSSLVC